MYLNKQTSDFLHQLDSFSGGKLSRREDLGILIELADTLDRKRTLKDLSFYAKFIVRSYGIMNRIGRGADGYEKLASEFTLSLNKAVQLAQALLERATVENRERFQSTYFLGTTTSMSNLMELFYSLSWYKNWLIDHAQSTS